MDSSSKGLTMPSFQQKRGNILIRPTKYSDIPTLANTAAAVYRDSVLSSFLCPYRHQHPHHFVRRFLQPFQIRHFDPRSIGFVAVEPSSPDKPVAYIALTRLGDDEPAKRLIASRDTLWRKLFHWLLQTRMSIVNYLWPDRSTDQDAARRFNEALQRDSEKYWESDEMKAKYGNRWHVTGLMVATSHQRRGIGQTLMAEAMQRAQQEGVVVGLEASADGEKLYRSLGFEIRGPFSTVVGVQRGGSPMMWTPRRME